MLVVMLGGIALPLSQTVQAGQSAPFNVQLQIPAPVDGTTVTLVSSNPAVLTITPSVSIAPGSTTPATQPQITGVAAGSVTVTATSGGYTGNSVTVNVTSPFPTITTTSLPNGVVNTAYSQALAASGGALPLTWSISAGSLPTSLTLTGNTISGTPSAAGTFNFTVKATDSSTPTPQTATQALSIVVGPALTITTTSLPNGVVSSAYSQALASSGGTGTITWSISAGSLPNGLTLTGNTISGTPSATGTFNFTVKATDSTTPTAQTATQALSIVVGPALTITTTSLPNGVVSSAYSQTLAASGGTGTITWSISAGSLPTSLTLTGNTISGTPSAAGTFNFTVKATDSTTPTAQTATQALSIVVGPALTITTTSLPNGVVSSAYSQTLASSGGTGTITWSISAGSLPNGLTLTGGTISGTPSAAGPFNFTVKATDSSTPPQTATQALSIVVAPVLTITTTSLPNSVVNSAYSQTLASSGGTGTITWSISAGSLPTSLTLTGSTISGTPSAAGTFNFTVKATDSTTPTAQTAIQALSITVGTGLTITTVSLPNGVVSSAYSQTLASSGGAGTITWSISAGSLPGSLTLSGNTISGTPTATGTFNFTVKATDSSTPPQAATQALSITINPGILTITTTSLPQGTPNTPYSFQPQVSGGTAPFTWSFSRLPRRALGRPSALARSAVLQPSPARTR